MANKHFTTSDVRRKRDAEQRRVREARQRAEQERRALLQLQRTFNVRGGRSVA
jgi:hypothetical protein